MNENSVPPRLERVVCDIDLNLAEFIPADDSEEHFRAVEKRVRAQRVFQASTRFLLDFFRRKRGLL
ncbi:MAG: hypothetical protein U1B30_10775 [Pseudomonadota bacterium]|nr:hypothetical protein [Pseudomonadota bacterium]